MPEPYGVATFFMILAILILVVLIFAGVGA
jgi:hypothetical protein